MAERPVVWVRWIDAVGEDARVNQDDIDAGKLDPLEMVSVGHVLREAPEYVVVAQDRYTIQGKQVWRNWITIPRVCIQEMAVLVGERVQAVAVSSERSDEKALPCVEEEAAFLRRRLHEAQRALADYYERPDAKKVRGPLFVGDS